MAPASNTHALQKRSAGALRDPRDVRLLRTCCLELALVVGVLRVGFQSWSLTLGLAPIAGAILCHVLNTTAHVHLHRPLFVPPLANRAFSIALSLCTAVPQSVWRARHLAHHAGRPVRGLAGLRQRPAETVAAAASFAIAALAGPQAAAGWVLALAWGLGLAQLQGRMEHVGGQSAGVSYYGRAYNWIWFNDGYHVEHHRALRMHWADLPSQRPARAMEVSALAPHVRWWAALHASAATSWRGAWRLSRAHALCALERLCFVVPPLAAAMVRSHARALALLAPLIGTPRAIAVVGGGLFPRSALALVTVFPEARITLVDARPAHLDLAREYLERTQPDLARQLTYRAQRVRTLAELDADLVLLPLAFEGEASELWSTRQRPAAIVHEWSRAAAGGSRVRVSRWLHKSMRYVPATAQWELPSRAQARRSCSYNAARHGSCTARSTRSSGSDPRSNNCARRVSAS